MVGRLGGWVAEPLNRLATEPFNRESASPGDDGPDPGTGRAIAEGKRGDLVLLDADSTADIRNSRRIEALLVNGRLIARDELDRLIDNACELLRAP